VKNTLLEKRDSRQKQSFFSKLSRKLYLVISEEGLLFQVKNPVFVTPRYALLKIPIVSLTTMLLPFFVARFLYNFSFT
jgi:hypothetical protein